MCFVQVVVKLYGDIGQTLGFFNIKHYILLHLRFILPFFFFLLFPCFCFSLYLQVDIFQHGFAEVLILENQDLVHSQLSYVIRYALLSIFQSDANMVCVCESCAD